MRPAGRTPACGRICSQLLPERLSECCLAVEVPCLDLAPALKKAAGQGTLTYFVDDEHWSPEGHAVVAEELARWIHENAGKDAPAK